MTKLVQVLSEGKGTLPNIRVNYLVYVWKRCLWVWADGLWGLDPVADQDTAESYIINNSIRVTLHYQ